MKRCVNSKVYSVIRENFSVRYHRIFFSCLFHSIMKSVKKEWLTISRKPIYEFSVDSGFAILLRHNDADYISMARNTFKYGACCNHHCVVEMKSHRRYFLLNSLADSLLFPCFVKKKRKKWIKEKRIRMVMLIDLSRT